MIGTTFLYQPGGFMPHEPLRATVLSAPYTRSAPGDGPRTYVVATLAGSTALWECRIIDLYMPETP
jgi:hypothetical protein